MGTLHEDQSIYFIISRRILPRTRNVSDKSRRENQNTHFKFSNFFENLSLYKIKWKKYCRAGHITDDNTAHAHCMLDKKATNTHSEYIILVAFNLQQWLQERPSTLRYTYCTLPVLLFFAFIRNEVEKCRTQRCCQFPVIWAFAKINMSPRRSFECVGI